MNSTVEFVQELDLNFRAKQPITIIYTDDPINSTDLVRDAIPVMRPSTDAIFYWSATTKWINVTNKNKSFIAHLADPENADFPEKILRTILQPIFAAPEQLKNARKPVFIVSLLPAKFSKDEIGIMQELRDFDALIRNGYNSMYRLIFIAPRSFQLQPDYENLMGVIEHKNPSREEVRTLYKEDFIKDTIETVASSVYQGDINQALEQFNNEEEYVVNTMTGLSARLIKIILHKALSKSAVRLEGKITSFDTNVFKEVLYTKKFEELSRDGLLSLISPVPMDQVGGMEALKEYLTVRAYACTPQAREKGVRKPKGILLLGPPGTGKSLVAQAMGDKLDRPILGFDISSVFNGLVGSSEARMKATLNALETLDSCVLLVEEIDKVFGANSGSGGHDGGVTARVLGKFLTWLQETKANVFVVMTANRVENIPPELLRPGRMDSIFYLALPNEEERRIIMDIHLRKAGYTLDTANVATEFNLFSSAELEHVVNEAVLHAAYKGEELTPSHLVQQKPNVRPQAVAFENEIANMAAWAQLNALPASKTTVQQEVKTALVEDNTDVDI